MADQCVVLVGQEILINFLSAREKGRSRDQKLIFSRAKNHIWAAVVVLFKNSEIEIFSARERP